MKCRVVSNVEELVSIQEEKSYMPEPSGILIVHPQYFDVIDVKNPYMQNSIGQVDRELAYTQWKKIYDVFCELKEKGVLTSVEQVNGVPDLEDMVFCANPVMTWKSESGESFVLLSQMQYERRQAEVDAFARYFAKKGMIVKKLSPSYKIEGNGDLIPHPGRRWLWMGYGYRSDVEVAQEVADVMEAHVIPLRLVSEHFYHLDTCFCVIDEDHVAICEEAFDEESLGLIRAGFKKVDSVSLDEAKNGFALNALVLRDAEANKYAILPHNNPQLKSIFEELQVQIYEVDTSEFIKSGGSVYCMKAFVF